MFYACSVWKRVLVSSGTPAMLAGPASNSASHGGPFNEERLDDSIRSNILERLIKQRRPVSLGWYVT